MNSEKEYPTCKYCGANMEKTEGYCDNCNTFVNRWRSFRAFTHRPEFFVVFFSTALILIQIFILLTLKSQISKVDSITTEILEGSSTYFTEANTALEFTTAVRHEFIYMRPDLTEVPGKRDDNGEVLKDAKGNAIKDYQDSDVPAIKIGTNTVTLHESECKRELMNSFASWNLCQQYANSFCNAYHPYNVDDDGNPKQRITRSIGSGLITSWGRSGIGVTCFNSKIEFPEVPEFNLPD